MDYTIATAINTIVFYNQHDCFPWSTRSCIMTNTQSFRRRLLARVCGQLIACWLRHFWYYLLWTWGLFRFQNFLYECKYFSSLIRKKKTLKINYFSSLFKLKLKINFIIILNYIIDINVNDYGWVFIEKSTLVRTSTF